VSENFPLFALAALGVSARIAYGYLWSRGKVASHSRVTVIGLLFVALVMGLIKYSQFDDGPLTMGELSEIFLFALFGPAFCVAIGLLRSFSHHTTSTFLTIVAKGVQRAWRRFDGRNDA
jgi:hypothetical protein